MKEPDHTRTKRDLIVQELRRRILVGDYDRAARLRQDELAEDFKVSITPVREALRVLESEGLVVSEPHKGVRVAAVDLDRVEAIYVSRRLIESFAIGRASIRMSRKDLTHQREILENMKGGSDGDLRLENRRFHFGFYNKCGIPELTTQIAALWDAFPWDLLLDEPGRFSRSAHDHSQILEAVEAGDATAAAAHMAAHIQSGYSEIRARLGGEGTPDPFDELEAERAL